MTGLEKMLSEIQDEANVSAKAVIDAAKKHADEIIAEAKAQGTDQSIAIAKKSDVDVADYLSRAKSAAALQKRKSILNAKQQIINEVIIKAQQSLYTLSDEEYFGAIVKMIPKFVLSQKGEILFSSKDLKRIPAKFDDTINKVIADKKAELVISKETRDIDGGFVLVYGGVEENCSFAALFDSAREALQDKVNEILFK